MRSASNYHWGRSARFCIEEVSALTYKSVQVFIRTPSGDFDEICIASYYLEDAERLAEGKPVAVATTDVEAAVRRSDIVCLASHSYTPVIQADWIRSGTHVSSVGYAPPAGELPTDLMARAKLFVEPRDAFKSPPVGCGELAVFDADEAMELGDMLTGVKPGRQSAN